MKKLYTLGIALSLVAFGTQSFAQVNKSGMILNQTPEAQLTVATNSNQIKATTEAKSSNIEVYWSEDFSNSFDGQGDNGAWNFDLENGELWFHTFPEGHENAYDPDSPLTSTTVYGDAVANYYSGAAVQSPTRNNGFMMIDTDRWSGTGAVPVTTALVSPTIDLSGLDITHGTLVFYQRVRACCSATDLIINAEISVDNGNQWIPYEALLPYGDINTNVNIEARIDISEAIQGALDAGNDLSQFKIRFLWTGPQSHYLWQIDDVSIESLDENDLEAGATWYNYHAGPANQYNVGEIDGLEYLKSFENARTPTYFARPLTFAMVVANRGSETQTGVQLQVTGIAPDGSTFDIPMTEPISMEYGVTDTLIISDFEIPNVQTGQYRFAYQVIQDQADAKPASNIGDTTTTFFTDESAEFNNMSIMQNGNRIAVRAYTTLNNNLIWGTPYSFPEVAEGEGAKAITHIQAAFLNTPDFAETVVGGVVYFNVRTGSGIVFEEDPDNPETMTQVVFGSDPLNYDNEEIEHTLAPEDIWFSDEEDLHYMTFELPVPVLIEPGVVYQAEVRIPFGNDAFLPISTPDERFSSTLYQFAPTSGTAGWYSLGTNTMPLRFRIQPDGVSVDKITYESGITLVQNYPNPFTDVTKIQFSVNKSDNVKFEVRDITGKLVFQKDMGTIPASIPQTYEFERGSLAPGMYTYSIVTADYQVSRKLTVQ